MIDRKLAVEQVKRLHWLFSPATVSRDAMRELVDELQESATNEDHADKTVSAILDSFMKCPMPRDIRRIAFELKPPEAACGCDRCGGSGFVVRQVGAYSGAVECECRRKPTEVAS